MKDSEVLAQARTLIDTPEKWIKGEWCFRTGCNFTYDRFCVSGAVGEVLGMYGPNGKRFDPARTDTDDTCDRILDELSHNVVPDVFGDRFGRLPGGMRIARVNDDEHTTHDDVMNLLDKGIARLEEQGR